MVIEAKFKECVACEVEKPTADFYTNLRTGKPEKKCRECHPACRRTEAIDKPRKQRRLCLLRICGFYVQGAKDYCKKHQKIVDKEGKAYFAGLPKRTHYTENEQPFKLEPWEDVYLEYQVRCVPKDREFKLSLAQFTELILGDCFYCGTTAESHARRRNGIDRLDNEVGYVAENCVSCCWKCNKAKGAASLLEFEALIKEQMDFIKHLKTIHKKWESRIK